MKTILFIISAVFIGIATVSPSFAQYSSRVVAAEPAAVDTLYNNGDFRTGDTSKSGVPAPTGYVWSESQNDTGVTTETNSVLGFGATAGAIYLEDDFTIPAGQTWNITSVTTWGFVQNWTGAPSPFTGGVLRIWSGRPGDKGSSVVFGDFSTDRLASSTRANVYAIPNSTTPAPGIPPSFTRELWENKFSVSPTLTLPAGTYWIEFATSTATNGAQFYRNVISPGKRGLSGWNSRQFSLPSTWSDVVDGGQPSTAPDIPQDIAFIVRGTVAATHEKAVFMDYDGDGKTDMGVTRWGVLPTDPSTWYILKSSTNYTDYISRVFGNRVGTNKGYSGTNQVDVVMPADYDGDGKTDIALFDAFRATSAAPETHYYIIDSSTDTLRIEQFGTRFDNGSIMGDYDGDGKADLAVYRNGATTGAQSTFWIKRSSDDKIVTYEWGLRGDRPFLGDFDGDGKNDIAVARVSSATGIATAYILRSSDASADIRDIAYPFTFIVPGDYDGDGKTDIATIKSSINDMLWTIVRSSDDEVRYVRCGIYSSDYPAQGDYNGDGITEPAIWRKSGPGSANPGTFWTMNPDGSFNVVQWGNGFDSSIASIRAY